MQGITRIAAVAFIIAFIASSAYLLANGLAQNETYNETPNSTQNYTLNETNYTDGANSTNETAGADNSTNFTDTTNITDDLNVTNETLMNQTILLNETNSSEEVNLTEIKTKKKLRVRDSAGREQPVTIREGGQEVAGGDFSVAEADLHEVVVFPANGPVRGLAFAGLNVSGEPELGLEELPLEKVPVGASSAWAVNPTGLQFESANVTAVATGTLLMKCKDWNWVEQRCDGSWTEVMGLMPDQDYTIGLSADDPAYYVTNYTGYVLHNESDSQYTTYLRMNNTTADVASVSSDSIKTTPTGVFCYVKTGYTNLKWITPNYTQQTWVNGTWNFSVYFSRASGGSGTPVMYLFGQIFKLNGTALYNIANTTNSADVGGVTTPTAITWSYPLTYSELTNLSVGERIGVQICVNITTAQGGSGKDSFIYWELTTPSRVVFPNTSSVTDNAPTWSNQAQNTSEPELGAAVLLSTYWTDDINLSKAILETNETGAFANKTTYGSPLTLIAPTNWSNFTWANASVPYNTAVAWRIYANDSQNQFNVTDAMTFTVRDKTPPTWSGNQSSTPANYSNTTASQFNITWTDNVEVDKVFLESNYSGTATNYTMTNATYGGSIYNYSAVLPAGTFYWKSYANDTRNNFNTSDTWYVTIGKAANTLNLTISPGNVTYPATTTTTCSATFSTPTLYRNGSALANQTNETILLGAGIYNYTCNITTSQNYSANSTSAILNVSQNQTNPIDIYMINSTGTFLNQNVTTEYGGSTTVNATLVYTNSGSAALYRNGTLVTNVTNDTQSLAIGDYAYKGNVTGNTNYSSNSTGATYWLFVRDRTPPNINLTSPLNRTYNTSWVWANATVIDLSPISWCGASLNNTANQTMSNDTATHWYLNVSVPAQGANNIKVFCNDTSGNMNVSITVYFTVDTIYPQITIVNPANDTYNYNVSVPLDYVLTETNPDMCWYRLDAGSIVNLPGCANTTFDAGPDGPHNITVYANDTANNTNSSTRYFTINTTAAFINIQSPDNATYATQSIWFNVTLSSAGDWCGYSLDAAANVTMSNDTTTHWYNLTTVPDDGHNVTFFCNNTAGQMNASEVRYFAVDTTPPTWSANQSSTPANYSTTNASHFNITWADNRAVDIVLLESNYSGTATNYTMTRISGNSASGVYNYNKTLPAGTFYWKSYANDTRGNSNTSDTWYVTIGQAANPLDIYMTNSTGTFANQNVTSEYGNSTTVNATMVYANSGSAALYRNGTLVTNVTNDTQILTPGDYEYKGNTSGNQNYTANATGATYWLFVRDRRAPTWFNQTQNTSIPEQTEPVLLSAYWTDNFNLSTAILETNETGAFANKTTYGSPLALTAAANWSNFTWSNSSVAYDTVVAWRIYANDTSGNQNVTDTMTFTIRDKTAPQWSGNQQSTPGSYSNTTLSEFRMNWTDNRALSVVLIEGNWSGTATNYSMSNATYGGPTYNYSAILPAGTFYWKSYANDTSNNFNTSDTFVFIIAKAANTLNLTISPGNVTYPATTTTTCSATFSTPTLYRNGSALANQTNETALFGAGIYNYTCNITTSQNYSANSTSAILNVSQNQTNPIDIYMTNSTGTFANQNVTTEYNGTTTVNVTMVYANSGSAALYRNGTLVTNVTNDTQSLAIGDYAYKGNVTGNTNYSSNSTGATYWLFVRDRTPPSITLTSPANTTYNRSWVWVNATATDLSGISSCQYSINGTANVSMSNNTATSWYANATVAQGANNAKVYCNDTQGNTNVSATVYFFIDSIYPQITIVNPASDTYNYNVSLALDYVLTEANPDMCWYRLDAGSIVNLPGCANTTFNAGPDGTHNITVYANDTVGNLNSSTRFFTINTTGAFITVQSPISQIYTTQSIWFNVSLSVAGSWCGYSLDAAANVTMSNDTTTHWYNLTTVPDNGHNVTFFCNNTVGQMNASSTVFFSVDTVFPTVNMTSPANTTYNRSWVWVNATVSETASWCGASINNTANQSLSNSSGNWNLNATVAQGANNAKVYCNDTAGNTNVSTAVYFFIDSIYPQIAIVNPQNTSYNYTAGIPLDYVLVEANPDQCRYRLDGGLEVALSGCDNTTFTAGSDGPHNITVYANDSANNTNSSTQYFLTDITAPNVTLNLPANGSILLTTNVTLNFTATDAVAATMPCTLYLNGTANQTNSSVANSTLTGFSFINMTIATYNWSVSCNDTLNNTGTSGTRFFTVNPSYATWNRTPDDFGAVSGLINSNVSLGTLVLNNTANFNHTFNIVSDWADTYYNVSLPVTVSSNSTTAIAVTATTAATQRQDAIVLNISTTTTNATPGSLLTNATLVSFVSGPYLFVSISNYSAAVLTSSSTTLTSTVKNLGNASATDVWLAWQLPSGWSITSGSSNASIGNLSVSATGNNSVTVAIASSAATGSQSITALAGSADNITGNDTKSVLVVASSACGNSVCESGETCASCPGDCGQCPGGGGGAVGPPAAGAPPPQPTIKTEAPESVAALVGGEATITFNLTSNVFGSRLENVTMTIDDPLLAQYCTVEPSTVDLVYWNASVPVSVSCDIPPYLSARSYDLSIKIAGTYVKDSDVRPLTRTLTVELVVSTPAEAAAANVTLNESVSLVGEMAAAGFNTTGVSALLEDAQAAVAKGDYAALERLAAQIKDIARTAFSVSEILDQLKADLASATAAGLDTPQTLRSYELAVAAFAAGDFARAEELAKAAQLSYILETKGKINLLVLVVRWWWAIAAGGAVIVIVGWLTWKQLSAMLIARRLAELEHEARTIAELIPKVQAQYFKTKEISAATYHKTMFGYESRLADIKAETAKLTAKQMGIMRPAEMLKALEREAGHIEKLVQETQHKYYEEGSITKRAFEQHMAKLEARRAKVAQQIKVVKAQMAAREGSAIERFVRRVRELFARPAAAGPKITKVKVEVAPKAPAAVMPAAPRPARPAGPSLVQRLRKLFARKPGKPSLWQRIRQRLFRREVERERLKEMLAGK